MAAHRKPRKLVSRAGAGALAALAVVAAAGGFALASGGGSTPKAATLDTTWAGSRAHVTAAYACLTAETVTRVSAKVPGCPAGSTRVRLAADSAAAVASDRNVTLYACLVLGTLTGVSTNAPDCPAGSAQVHWAAESGLITSSSPPSRVPDTSAKPTPTPSPKSPASPSQSSSAAPKAPPAPAPSTSSPAPAATPGSMTQCTTNQNGGANNHVTQLDDNTYHLQANEWNSGSTFTVCTNGNADFTISSSGINVSHDGAPGAYPSLYKGCHWGYCTADSGMPVAVSAMTSTPDKVTTSYSTSTVNNGAWDDSYDIWYNPASSTNNNSSGLEMMIWLNHFGGIQPAGSPQGTVTLDGISFTVWYGGSGNGGTVSFVANNPVTSVSNLDLGPLAGYAVSKGYMQNSWYLIDVEAGFEPWTSGQGLTADSFNVTVN